MLNMVNEGQPNKLPIQENKGRRLQQGRYLAWLDTLNEPPKAIIV